MATFEFNPYFFEFGGVLRSFLVDCVSLLLVGLNLLSVLGPNLVPSVNFGLTSTMGLNFDFPVDFGSSSILGPISVPPVYFDLPSTMGLNFDFPVDFGLSSILGPISVLQ